MERDLKSKVRFLSKYRVLREAALWSASAAPCGVRSAKVIIIFIIFASSRTEIEKISDNTGTTRYYVFDLEEMFFFAKLHAAARKCCSAHLMCHSYSQPKAGLSTHKTRGATTFSVRGLHHHHHLHHHRGVSLGHGAAGLQLYLLLDADS